MELMEVDVCVHCNQVIRYHGDGHIPWVHVDMQPAGTFHLAKPYRPAQYSKT